MASMAFRIPLSSLYIQDQIYAQDTIEIRYGVNILFCRKRFTRLSLSSHMAKSTASKRLSTTTVPV